MGHRLVFGTAAACALAIPVATAVYTAQQGNLPGVFKPETTVQAPPAPTVTADREEARPAAPAGERADDGTGNGTIATTAPAGRSVVEPAPVARVEQDAASGEIVAAPPPAPPALDRSRQQQAISRLYAKPRGIAPGAGAAKVAPAGEQLYQIGGGVMDFGAPSGDRVTAVEANPVKAVAEDPVSTFSIDVDTASYARVRRLLNQGVLPRPGDVRVEEMINYFSYDYPLPTSRDVPFRPSVAVYPTPWNADTRLVHIGIKGLELAPAERPRANLVFLIDTSGSMQGADRLPLLQTAFRLLLDTLDANDTVSIVAYAGRAGTVLEPTRASDKAKIVDALTRLTAGGSTAGAAGIREAYAMAEKSFDKDGVNRVILATDGDFNVGMSSVDQLKSYIAEKRKSGVFLSVLGFGQGNTNDALMQALAQNGNGNAAYIDTLKEAEKVLVTEATSTLFPIAKDVKIQVEFNPATVSAYRLIGYETRMLKREDFNNDRVDAGEIGSGHTVTAIYEITPVGAANPIVDDLRYGKPAEPAKAGDPNEYAYLKMRFKAPDSDASRKIELPITRDMEKASVADLGADMRFAAAVAAFGQKLAGNSYLADYSYDAIRSLAASAKGADRFGFRAEFVDLVRLAGLLSPTPAQTDAPNRD